VQIHGCRKTHPARHDLGTTNTCVAYVRNKVARVVPSDKGSLILPSVVAMSDKGDLLVGGVAKDQMVVNPRTPSTGPSD